MPRSVVAAPPPLRRRRRPKPEAADGGEQYNLKAITRAFDVLECFSNGTTSLSLKEIGRLAKLPESSLFRILLTLKNRGYLTQNDDGSYRLPPKLVYGRQYEQADTLRAVARPHLEWLASRFDETASLACLLGDHVRVLDTVETFQDIRMGNRPGRVLPPHCSSLGKAIAAYQTPELMDRMLEVYGLFRRTENTIVDRRALLIEFGAVRERGFACDREETVLGGLCIGAPILHGTEVRGAVSVSTPLVRMSVDLEKAIGRGVVEAASRISTNWTEDR
jgi:IclR family acetate operon transcriptional repressor